MACLGALLATTSGQGNLADANGKPGAVTVLEHKPSEMVFVGSGEFSMGMADGDDELKYFLTLCNEDMRRIATRLCTQQMNLRAARGASSAAADASPGSARLSLIASDGSGSRNRCVRWDVSR